MKPLKTMTKIALATALALGGTTTFAGGGAADWGYSGDNGPEHWASLHPEYSACSGKNQSPIDLKRFTEADLPSIPLVYYTNSTEIVNKGHTVQVNFDEGSTIELDGKEFELKQLHFHSPSENTYYGSNFPLEMQLVHADADGNLAVVAVMFRFGPENEDLQKIWDKMPELSGEIVTLAEQKEKLNAKSLLPHDGDYFRFNGSLTTPPCSEGVRWLVLKNVVFASEGQIAKFQEVIGEPNNRPVQPLNARTVMQ